MNKFVAAAAALLAVTAMTPVAATTTVATFDTFTGGGVVPDGYAGITWGGNWIYYDGNQDPFNPASPPERIYRDYSKFGSTGTASVPFYFSAPVVFNGAAISGFNSNPVTFDLYKGGILVFTSVAFVPTSTSTFYSPGYSGKVDEIRFTAGSLVVFDNITYSSGTVPEPAAWALMVVGFGLVGIATRRRLGPVAA